MNTSVLFMLAMVFSIPLVVAGLVWRSFRAQARSGRPFAPEGKLRWDAPDDASRERNPK